MDSRTTKKRLPRVCAVVLSGFLCGSIYVGEWEKPWDSVKGAAAQSCAKTFEDFQLQAVCMDNEKKDYDRTKNY